MIAIDAGRAEYSEELLENCRRELDGLAGEAERINSGLRMFSGMDEVRQSLTQQIMEMNEAVQILGQMDECLLTGIRMYMKKESMLADYAEEVQAAGMPKTGEWEMPDWAFALLR